MQASRIALQNCLRCHREGDIGGTKSPFGWPQMALIAQGNPIGVWEIRRAAEFGESGGEYAGQSGLRRGDHCSAHSLFPQFCASGENVILRLSKTLLVAAVALFYTLVVLNNLTDYGSNYAFVHHVLLMDSTFPGNHGMWRAIHPLWMHAAFYDTIIVLGGRDDVACCGLEPCNFCARWASRARGSRTRRRWRSRGLTVSLLMWLVAFLCVGR